MNEYTPVRVCLVTSNPRWEGTEAQIASLAAAFRGDPNVALHAALFHSGALVEALEAAGVPVRIVPVGWQLDLSAVWRLARVLRAWRIDVLHSHGYKANVIGALAARMAGVPVVVRTEHGLPEPFQGFRRMKMGLYLWADRLVGRRMTDAMIAVAEDVASDLRRRFPRVPVYRIHNGIGPGSLHCAGKEGARRALDLAPGSPVVGIIGRLVPIKDHHTFLAAAQRIAREEPATQFVIAGNGPLEEALKSEAGALGIREQVHFRYVPGGAQPVLDALDVLVFSSRHEGIPYALLEALRAEVPVVATAVGGLAEALTHEHDALLVRPKDPEGLAAAVLRLLRDPGLARELGRRGRETLNSRFSLERMREQTAAAYGDALRFAGQKGRSAVRAFGRSMVRGEGDSAVRTGVSRPS